MDTLTSPTPDTPLTPDNDSATPVSLPAGPICSACASPAIVHWQRRPTDQELDALRQLEEDRRATALLLADPQLPAPVFPPLPTAADTCVAVYACGTHAITMDAAALVHQSSCTAPNDADLPGCDCTPEAHPTGPAADTAPGPVLPDHWLPAGP
ncbi:hypothetical protein ACFUEN_28870 [Streptomyces griseorubiginosus]|uniref:hypothetical protein n=1 Tax=Streptomyces griseorubiginosus TaxID=67304 RepID=UPI00363B29E1